jgi:hypothetical protein
VRDFTITITYSCGGHRGAVQGNRGLSEHSERYPRLALIAGFLARLRRARIWGVSFTGGCALRAYPRLHSLHRSAVPRTNTSSHLRRLPRLLNFFPSCRTGSMIGPKNFFNSLGRPSRPSRPRLERGRHYEAIPCFRLDDRNDGTGNRDQRMLPEIVGCPLIIGLGRIVPDWRAWPRF